MSNNRWGIVVLVMGCAALGQFNRVGITVAGDEVFIPKLGISKIDMGWVYTTFLIVYTIGMLPGGWLIDRIGSARALALFGLTMGAAVVLTGALGWVAHTPTTLWIGLLVIRGLAGLCSAPLHPGAAHVVSEVMPPHRRASANGMITAGALIGIACCYPGFGWLMDKLTWPWAFVVSGSLLMGYSLLWLSLAGPRLPHPRPAWLDSDLAKEKKPAKDDAKLPAAWSFLNHPSPWLLTLSYAAYGYFQYLFFYWMGYYFKDVLDVPDVKSRWAQFWIMLAMGAGMAIGGQCTDIACRWLRVMPGRRAVVLVGMGFGAGFALLAVNVASFTSVTLCLALSMAAAGMVEGVFWTTATDLGGNSRGLSGAFMNAGGNVGGLLSPLLTPVMAKQMGWPNSIAVACAISALGGIVWFAIKPPFSRHETNPPC